MRSFRTTTSSVGAIHSETVPRVVFWRILQIQGAQRNITDGSHWTYGENNGEFKLVDPSGETMTGKASMNGKTKVKLAIPNNAQYQGALTVRAIVNDQKTGSTRVGAQATVANDTDKIRITGKQVGTANIVITVTKGSVSKQANLAVEVTRRDFNYSEINENMYMLDKSSANLTEWMNEYNPISLNYGDSPLAIDYRYEIVGEYEDQASTKETTGVVSRRCCDQGHSVL